jgi:hypothetical protein
MAALYGNVFTIFPQNKKIYTLFIPNLQERKSEDGNETW